MWKEILKDKQIINLYESINRKTNFYIDHGILHVKNVINYIDHICKVFNVDEKTKNLTKIAGILHDAGRMKSREEHAKYSTEFAKDYLKNKLTKEDIDIVLDAISHHDRSNFDYNSNNMSAWILLMADKMDYTRKRYIKTLVDEEAKTKFSYYIKKIYLTKRKNKATACLKLFKNRPIDFEEKVTKILDVYTKVITYFGYVAEIKFI